MRFMYGYVVLGVVLVALAGGVCLGTQVKESIDLYDADWPDSDDHVANFVLTYDWECAPDGGLRLANESASITRMDAQGAKLDVTVTKKQVDSRTWQIRLTGSGSWKEWSLLGGIGGALAGGAAAAGSVVTFSGGTAAIHPAGWVIIGTAAVGGGIAGALTFSSNATATFDVAWQLNCVGDESGGWKGSGPRLVFSNVNDSSGDLYWQNQSW